VHSIDLAKSSRIKCTVTVTPYQIVLKAADCAGENDTVMGAFCADLSLCPVGHSYVENDERMRVFCFAEKAHAEKFQAQFGGAWFDPSRKRRGPGWAKLKEPRKKKYF
jgi:hypothetical protein